MRFIGLVALACLLAGAVWAQPAPASRGPLTTYLMDDPGVPPDIRAEFRPDDTSSPASCKLVDWLFAPNSPLPPPLRTTARSLSPVCTLPAGHIAPSAASEALGDRSLAMTIDGHVITLFARSASSQPPRLCCSLQAPMQRLGAGDLWALQYRLEKLDEAMLSFRSPDGALASDLSYRGPHAPAPPPTVKALTGRLLPDTLYSQALGETRKLQIYIPLEAPPPGGWPALFLADGDNTGHQARIVEAMVEAGLITPIVLIGTASGQEGIVEDRTALGIADLRSADYLPEYPSGKGRFARHMTFLSRELVDYARTKYGITSDRTKIAISGFSNGGQLAFEAAVAHPEVFGAAIPMSAGWKPITANPDRTLPRARFYASAGAFEPSFMRSTSASVAALKAAGYQAEFTPYAAGHMTDQWDVALARGLTQVFGVRP